MTADPPVPAADGAPAPKKKRARKPGAKRSRKKGVSPFAAPLDAIALAVVEMDEEDPSSVIGVAGRFGALAQTAGVDPRAAEAARAAESLLERLGVDDFPERRAGFEAVADAVSGLRAILVDGAHPASVRFAAPLGLSEPDAAVLPPAPTGAAAAEFAARIGGLVEDIEKALLAIERGGERADDGSLKRALHTIKGDAGVAGFARVARVCHAAEDLLGAVAPAAAIEPLLAVVDWLRAAGAAAASGTPEPDPEPLLSRLRPPAAPGIAAATATQTSFLKKPELLADFVVEATGHLDDADERLLALEASPGGEEPLAALFRAFHTIKGVAGFLHQSAIVRLAHDAESLLDLARRHQVVLAGEALQAVFETVDLLRRLVAAAGAGAAPADSPLVEPLLRRLHAARDPNAVPPATVAAPAASGAPAASSRAQPLLKIDAGRLDRLVDTIGELVILEQAITQKGSAPPRDAGLAERYAALDKITREVQGIGTALRMVPLRATFQRMARVVRDLARKQGKQARLVTAGDDAEMDRQLVDAISDPLIHIIRNAVDHGVEATPADRERAGKPAEATISLRAFHRGGSIVIEVADDGRGLDRARLVARAVERGLLRPGEPVSDEEAHALIFAAGFSTAEKVTDVSGRGVGMDVVKRTVEALRGHVDIATVPGRGTTIALRLPLTLAIIDGMVIRTGSERYVVPSTSIIRSVQVLPGGLRPVQSRGEVFVQDSELLPALRLSRAVGLPDAGIPPIAVVVEDEGRRFALLVDEVVGQQQIVIKPLGPLLEGVRTIAGGAILADGTAGLILSLSGIASAMLGHAPAAHPQPVQS